ncbi:MAG: cardiolipin synthase B [Gemmatimonadetes bacterium]|nr:cardiolipin synthase B [Gemmatimonadota bacterium]MCB9518490.1 cardiolipin synthase B [Gemmatimonadales bacterium]HPF61380.1 phospholipase D-like domain-containing protein [Gemmatimonadales bacterium]HRX17631.1 phospholipase D-like domain-containing protein [Gemmatimonadales bacterium]
MTAPPSSPPGGDLDRALDRAGAGEAIPGNIARLLIDGPDNYAAMLEMIAGATRRIHLENYIIRDDATGRRFADALIDRVAAGVRVRILYDWLGSIGTGAAFWRRLREAGIEVRCFGRPRLLDPMAVVARDHRKLLVVDGHRAVTGGLCIGDEWTGDPARQRLPWRDTGILVEGPAARAMDHAFQDIWVASGGVDPDDGLEVEGDISPAGPTTIRVVATRPGDGRAWRVLDLLLGLGSERIWVTDAYLAAPARLYQVFQDAAADGVDVRLLVPGASDLPLVRNVSRTGYRKLLRSGVRIWEWGGAMLHAKTALIDGRWVRVGSSNLNPSSLMANWEIDLFIEDRALAEEMSRQFADDLAHSREILTRPRLLPPVPVFGRPTALVADPSPLVPARRPGPRGLLERRRRAVIRGAALIRAARSALLGTAGGVLVAMAVVLVLFPRLAAYSTAAVAGLIGIVLLGSALGRRGRG